MCGTKVERPACDVHGSRVCDLFGFEQKQCSACDVDISGDGDPVGTCRNGSARDQGQATIGVISGEDQCARSRGDESGKGATQIGADDTVCQEEVCLLGEKCRTRGANFPTSQGNGFECLIEIAQVEQSRRNRKVRGVGEL